MNIESYRPYDMEHPPVIGSLVNWNEGSGLLTGWYINPEKNILYVSVGSVTFTAQELLEKCWIDEDTPCGYIGGI